MPSTSAACSKKISFLAFYLMWAERMRWTVPDIHVRACNWLEHRGDLAVLRCFRGFGKSTILAVYNAWRYYINNTFRILHQGESDGTAYKTSRDTQNVLRNHPLTKGMLPDAKGTVEQWWVEGATDYRNASMYAKGILSNVTSARADECQNDDVEVPKNIQTPDAREKLRYRLGEQTHILVPGGAKLYVGTPHTHDSLYDEIERMGADCLTIKMFAKEYRIEVANKTTYAVPFSPDIVFLGIGPNARLLQPGKDYLFTENTIAFHKIPNGLIDCYKDIAWQDRFDKKELLKRRTETRTINEWDSQYQLHSKPVGNIRLDPTKIIPYELQPIIKIANNEVGMWLGTVRIVGASAWWDCSLGKIKSDASAFSLILTDERGRLYWQVCEALTGDLDAQCARIKALVMQYQIPRVVVETNGPGGFVPPILRKHLAGTGCGVGEEHSSTNKQKRILDAFEPPLSSGFLWAHSDVLDGPVWDQMKDFNPAVKDQPDDYIDSGAGAISQTPIRIGKFRKVNDKTIDTWLPEAGVHDVQVDY
jgi:hypothetical protein